MVPPRLVPATPQTNTLYPGADSSTPIFSARSARSCPMKPSRNSACAVVSNGMRDSSQRHRNLAGANSSCTGTALMSLEVIERGTLTYRHVARPYFGFAVEYSVTSSQLVEAPVRYFAKLPNLRGASYAREIHPSRQPQSPAQPPGPAAQIQKVLRARQ